MHELRLKRFAFADIEQRSGKLHRPPLAITKQHPMIKEMLPLPISALPTIFEDDALQCPPPLDAFDGPFPVIRVKALLPKTGCGGHLLEAISRQCSKVAGHELRDSRLRIERLGIKHDRQRGD